ncbi:PaaI family thioesterase [Demequina flava]|uniref:PaaI family thioesterase n=1 Tax=Demequina flava TaxID=1095025 RepID=UPI0007813EE1|nr:PaaI family thioesterase [Demequina flava]
MTDNDAATSLPGDEANLITLLGITIDEEAAERVSGTMPVAGNTQPYGLLHGGASAALAETLASIGAMHHAGADGIAVGVDLNITHHRPASAGHVYGVAQPLHLGRTTATYAVGITDESGQTIATARLTCAIRPRRAT